MESTIWKLFDSKNRRFEIPSYQRAYSWGKVQIDQFLEDLKNAESQYYLGHFLFETKDNTENTLLVIDGQQRLTTCIIFFSVLKKCLAMRLAGGENIFINLQDIEDYYLRDLRKGTQKFATVRDDNNFFIDEIIDGKESHSQEPTTTSKIRIREAKETIQKYLSIQSIADIERWYRLIEKATITEYIVKDKTQATQVFAFQNDRGKKLSNLEILKAYFMLQIYLAGVDKESIEENIRYLEEDISQIYKQIVRIKTNEDEVLNYYWRSVSGDGFSSDEVIKGIKDKIALLSKEKTHWIKSFISGLSKAFLTVEKIETSNESYTKDLRYLNNMALAYPFIIKLYQINASDAVKNRFIRLLENITFRYLLRGGRAEIESRLNRYLSHLIDIEEAEKNIETIIWNINNDPWWSYWNDQALFSYLGGYFYKSRVDNYVLWKYEMYLADDHHPMPHKVSFDELISHENIEHIAPQTPTDNNPTENGYGIYKDENDANEGIASGGWLNCIGNLMLISRNHNIKIGNDSFASKLSSYGEANLLNQQKEIVSFVSDKNIPVWDKTAIEKRKQKIIAAAMKIWDLQNIRN